MACPCCGPKWVCYQCCCPDGSNPKPSITVRVVANQSYRVPYEIFEGTYTLPLDLTTGRTDSQVYPTRLQTTCVKYSFTGVAADGGCGGPFGDLSKYISFQQQVNGDLITLWGFSGRDDQNRCIKVAAASYAYPAGRPVANLCSGLTGLLFSDIQFLVTRSGAQALIAAFDVYID